MSVVSSQAEALADGTKYAYGFITTKCLPDVLPTTTIAKDAIASGQVGAWLLIQVSRNLTLRVWDFGVLRLSSQVGLRATTDRTKLMRTERFRYRRGRIQSVERRRGTPHLGAWLGGDRHQ